MVQTFSGTLRHQQILQTIVTFYANDNRIRAVILFGSLARGNWDDYSDIDLDIVIQDEVELDVGIELKNLCDAIQSEHNLKAIIISFADEGDVVLSNLLELSIRYHTLDTTKSAILDTMQILSGEIAAEKIIVVGEANRYQPDFSPNIIVNQCIRYALEIHNAIARKNLWLALELNHRIQALLMQLFVFTHGGNRPIQFFEANAHADLQAHLKSIVPQPTFSSLKTTLETIIALLESKLGAFCRDTYQLNAEQRSLLEQIKKQM